MQPGSGLGFLFIQTNLQYVEDIYFFFHLHIPNPRGFKACNANAMLHHCSRNTFVYGLYFLHKDIVMLEQKMIFATKLPRMG